MNDLSLEELDRIYEGSKDDLYIIVGSEVRQMVGMIRRSAARIEALEAALREIANNVDFPSGAECRAIARAALDKDDGK